MARLEKPDHECPRCGRNQWEDVAGFGTFQPTWACGYCGLQAQDPDKGKKGGQ